MSDLNSLVNREPSPTGASQGKEDDAMSTAQSMASGLTSASRMHDRAKRRNSSAQSCRFSNSGAIRGVPKKNPSR